jgi:hypothetical protein
MGSHRNGGVLQMRSDHYHALSPGRDDPSATSKFSVSLVSAPWPWPLLSKFSAIGFPDAFPKMSMLAFLGWKDASDD